MHSFIVLYRTPDNQYPNPPRSFLCHTEDKSLAKQCCKQLHENAEIVWVTRGWDRDLAYLEFLRVEEKSLPGDSHVR